jgi:hypothetical protein
MGQPTPISDIFNTINITQFTRIRSRIIPLVPTPAVYILQGSRVNKELEAEQYEDKGRL